jgi:hypothetical protein
MAQNCKIQLGCGSDFVIDMVLLPVPDATNSDAPISCSNFKPRRPTTPYAPTPTLLIKRSTHHSSNMSRHQQKQQDLWSFSDNEDEGSSSDDHVDPSWLVRIRNLNRRSTDGRPSDSNSDRAMSHRFVQARIVRRATGCYLKKRQSQRSQRRMRLPAHDFSNLSFPEYSDLSSTQAESPAQDSPPFAFNSE